MNHKRILAAVSLSDGRDAAFEHALSLARVSGATLYLLHVVPASQPFSSGMAERLQRSVQLRERAAAAGVRALSIQQHGDPAEMIVLHAESRGVDLIVMGTEPRARRTWFGERSVAERVLRRTRRPTLVVRRPLTDGQPAFGNVLVAVDLSTASSALVEVGLQWSRGEGRGLTVVHAVDTIEARDAVHSWGRWVVPEYRGYVLDEARRRLSALLPEGAPSGIRVHAAAGPAAETIGACAARTKSQLIVMGRSPRFMDLGSTALQLLRSSESALLVVPPEASVQALDREPSVQQRAA